MTATNAGWTEHDVPDQAGKTIIVTGGNSGIGYETARLLADRGAHVILAVRNAVKGQAALAAIRDRHPHARVEMAPLDLANLSSVRAFAEWIDEEDHPVHVLVNNAGVMGAAQGVTADGFETHFGTNHLGHFALTGLLIERLLTNPDPRVVTVSSLAHRRASLDFTDLQSQRNYRRQRAYGISKLANLLFTMELQRRVRRIDRDDLKSTAAHPGLAQTNIAADLSGAIPERLGGLWNRAAPKIAQSAADGALPSLRAATDPDARGGDYYGPAGFGELRGPAVRVKVGAKGLDVHDARALWEASVELTGIDYAVLDPT